MMTLRRTNLALLPLIAVLSGCAGSDSRYPSLAMRPFETAAPPAAVEPAPAPIRPLADPAQLAALMERAMAADTAFTGQQPTAAALARAASGQPVESNARARALVAMADLASKRGATSSVLADLDQLAAASATSFAPAQDIEAVRTRVAALVAGQDAAMTRLWEVIGS
ncbi:MAG: hypothetical protein RSE14_00100 [Erythrobacter sp.]|jgi:hypothetical protein|uniref:hypothetical protein n=1 Tax=Erythrobacter sp. TaxID=1042 RepID=UPI002B48A57E|nr:hypothetical protein [Erythrobacter sp.]WRH70531.1 MAG: hypothetical protein RSE14_00100 [Erythrobacter sp.]